MAGKMSIKRIFMVLTLGISVNAFAGFPEKGSLLFEKDLKDGQPFSALFSKLPTEYTADMLKKDQTPLKKYKNYLKKLATLNVNSRLEIGLDSFKMAPLTFKYTEILDMQQGELSHLKQADSAQTRGYGVEFRVKLD
jgi:hypothetical protein